MTAVTGDPEGPAPSSVDGRSARRTRNRDAVLDAVHELFTERNTFPTLESVAARSGVSLRSIHRYFPDNQGMMLEAIARRVALTDPLFQLDGLGQGTLEERITSLVDQRLAIYAASSATIRVALAVADTMPLIAAQVQHRQRELAGQARTHFAREAKAMPAGHAEAMLTCVELLCQFESIDLLLEHRGWPTSAVRETLRSGLRALLSDPSAG